MTVWGFDIVWDGNVVVVVCWRGKILEVVMMVVMLDGGLGTCFGSDLSEELRRGS